MATEKTGIVMLGKGGSGTLSEDLTATEKYVMEGYTYVGLDTDDDIGRGTMRNYGDWSNPNFPMNGTVTIPEGYHDGNGTVSQHLPVNEGGTYNISNTDLTAGLLIDGQSLWLTGDIIIPKVANLTSENIFNGVTIFNVTGTYQLPVPVPSLVLTDFDIRDNAVTLTQDDINNYDLTKFTVTGTMSASTPGTYSIRCTLKDSVRTKWADNRAANYIDLVWRINCRIAWYGISNYGSLVKSISYDFYYGRSWQKWYDGVSWRPGEGSKLCGYGGSNSHGLRIDNSAYGWVSAHDWNDGLCEGSMRLKILFTTTLAIGTKVRFNGDLIAKYTESGYSVYFIDSKGNSILTIKSDYLYRTGTVDYYPRNEIGTVEKANVTGIGFTISGVGEMNVWGIGIV